MIMHARCNVLYYPVPQGPLNPPHYSIENIIFEKLIFKRNIMLLKILNQYNVLKKLADKQKGG